MAGVNRISDKLKVVSSSSRRKRKRSPFFLPEEILFSILLKLPVEVLCNVMRYVCREWYNVINDPCFIDAHLQKSTNCLLIQSYRFPNFFHFVEIHDSDIQTRMVRYEFPMSAYSSCDGLILFRCNEEGIFYVANPTTMQLVKLPPLSSKWCFIRAPLLTYFRSTGRCKVVLILRDENNHNVCLILTVGADSAWRQIDTKHFPDFASHSFSCKSFSTGGYIYLTCDYASHLFALDAEAEIFHRFPKPDCTIGGKYMVWKSFLGLVAHHAAFVWELWALTDLNTGKWTKLLYIDLRGKRCKIEQKFDVPYGESSVQGYLSRKNLSLDRCLVPIASLKNGEVLIFRGTLPFKTYIVFNLKTRKVSSFVICRGEEHASNFYVCHINNLVLLNAS
ncbi:putative F-box protein At1g47730 [Cornus florida]|uniref:putative F-box protein At1g47730 n=1 Tax=Cornus florida TaxID=4283 RepID=UPI00289945CE|nr:putative F-box protein At1g47730 [Cornus florida]